LGPALGGEFAAARIAWAEAVAAREASPVHDAVEALEPGAAAESLGEPHGRRRRGRRGGRGRRKDRVGDAPAAPVLPAINPAPAAATPAKLPPVWDDNYFFAALPSVPAHVEGDDTADSGRYIAGVVPVTEPSSDGKPSPAPRRRRRGGRRHRGGGATMPPTSSPSSSSEGDAS